MGRTPIRAKLVLDVEARSKLEAIAKSRTEGHARIERAKVLLALSFSALLNRPTCALQN